MQVESGNAVDRIVLAPALGGTVGAAHKQPMQHGQKHRAFQREFLPACAGKIADHRTAAGLLPQPLEHQGGPDPAHRNLARRIIGGGAEHHGLGRKARTRTQQPFQLPTRLQILVAAERGNHLLANLITFAPALDDLEIGAPGRGLAAKVHIGSMCWCAQSRDSIAKINR